MNFRKVTPFIIVMTLLIVSVMPAFAVVETNVIADYLANVPEGWGIVSVEGFATEILENEIFVLDVRETAELEETGYIEGAVHVPLREVAANLNLLPADLDTPIVIYCKSGHRGAIGMTALQVLGYTNVRNLKGGILGWLGEDYPVVMDPIENPEPGDMPPIDEELVASVDNYLMNDLPQGWGVITVDNLATEMLETEIFLLDVRETSEWEGHGYIEGAVNIPLRELGTRLDEVPMDMPIVIYCHSGHRGAIGMTALQMLGYDVRNLAGAITAWETAGYPIVGGTQEEEMGAELDLVAHLDNYLMNDLPEGWGIVSVDALSTELLETEVFLLDVREANELEEIGYIPGAVHIPVRELASNLDLLPADLDANIVIYCKSGTRGAIGMTALQVLGYKNVRNLKGGILAWTGEDFEVATEPIQNPEPGDMPEINPDLIATVDDYMMNVLPQGWGIVRPDDLAVELVENPDLFLLDVRETSEWDEHGYIEGAVNIPLREVVANLDQIPMDAPIVVYCHSGHRGMIGTVVLQMLGYDARNLGGAITAWETAGYPIVGGTQEDNMGGEDVEVEVVYPTGTAIPVADLVVPVTETVQTIALQDGFGTITNETFSGMMDDVFIVDVREDNEWEEGHIPGAIHIPLREVAMGLQYLPAFDEPIVIYCAAGHRGAIAQFSLVMLGYENVMNLRTGFNGWDGEVTTDEVTMPAGEFPAVDADVWTTVNEYLTGLEGFGVIRVADFDALLLEGGEVVVIDVREAGEYEGGFIAGAVNMPTRSFTDFAAELPENKDVEVVVYGSSGPRGATVMTGLQMLGYKARNLGGGSAGWQGAGYELVTE